MKYGIALLSIVPMRKEPMEQSEMVNQVLFGECYQVLNETTSWIEIRTLFDNYSGWIDSKLHNEVSESDCRNLTGNQINVLDALLMNVEVQEGKPVTIVAGSTLPGYDRKKNIMTIENRIFRINWTFGKVQSSADRQLVSIAEMFQNTPYLWGGRTVFGCDCSGFVQTVYKIMGHALERDASEQARQGEIIKDLTETQTGDLAFFANDEGKVIHVGLIIAPGRIMHCSGYVHEDLLDIKGILNAVTHQYTHSLHSIRRIR